MSSLGLLQVALIVLKLINYIDWSWWLVLTPFYIWIVGVGVIFIVAHKRKQKLELKQKLVDEKFKEINDKWS